MASDVADIHDIDLEVYGTKIDDVTATTTSTITSYNFEVCTLISLINVEVRINVVFFGGCNFSKALLSSVHFACSALRT